MGRNHLRAIFLLASIALLSVSASETLRAQGARQNSAQQGASQNASPNTSQAAQDQGTSDQGSSDQSASDQGSSDQGGGDQGGASAAAATPAPAPSRRTFVVNGKTVNAEVLVVDGRSYVDIDSLAQIAVITNGSMTVEPTRISLTIPVEGSGGTGATGDNAAAQNAAPQSVQGFSRAFVANAIGALAEMREWRGATETMITYGLAVSESWARGYQSRAQDDLTQATLAATTDDDRSALTLLRNEFDTLSSWSGQTMAARQALNGAPTIDPNTLANDQTLTKIRNCGDFLSSMLLGGAYSDNASCH